MKIEWVKWKKGEDRVLDTNLHSSEVECKCNRADCIEQKLHTDTIYIFQTIRDILGQPIPINSGYRCLFHNKIVGGTPNSQHTLGKALDLDDRFISVNKIAKAVKRAFIMREIYGGLGKYNGFIHFDTRGYMARW